MKQTTLTFNYCKRKLSLIFYCVFISFFVVSCISGKRALLLVSQKKHEKAKVMLDRMLEKDSSNVDAKYAYSVLFSDTAYRQYNLDSAYWFILSAREQTTLPDTLENQKTLASKYFADSLAITQQKLRVDSLAFLQATHVNSVAAYQKFLDNFPTAAQVDQATFYRNQLAYEAASKANTYQAYDKFINNYPDAKQVEQARNRYNNLVFKEMTKEGTLESYLTFLSNYPETPYRSQAERAILEISTANNFPASYLTFLQRFPKSVHARLAVNLLYHLFKTSKHEQSFFDTYGNLPYADSLLNAYTTENDILIPFYEDNHYGFFNSTGNIIAKPQYDGMVPDYFCQGVTTDFLHVLQKNNNQFSNKILTKQNQVVFEYLVQSSADSLGDVAESTVMDLGCGMLKIKDETGYKLIHKSGYTILEDPAGLEEIVLCGEPTYSSKKQMAPPFQFIKFKKDGLWGLSTFTGKIVLEPIYVDIELSENFVLLAKEERYAITNREKILEKANNMALSLSFIYEDFSVINENNLVAYEGDLETVIDDQLDMVVPLAEQSVIRPVKTKDDADTYWLLRSREQDRQYFMYGKKSGLDPTFYQKAYYDKQWLALKKDNKYKLIDLEAEQQTNEMYDSVKILSENFIILYHNLKEYPDSVSLVFRNHKKIVLEPGSGSKKGPSFNFRLLQTAGTKNKNNKEESSQYLLISNSSRDKQVYDMRGKLLFKGVFEEVTLEAPGLFVVETRGKKGLLDSLGNTLLSPKYQGIGNFAQGNLAVLDRSKFGLYNPKEHVFIKPGYDAILKEYTTNTDTAGRKLNLYIAKKSNKAGLINGENKTIIPFNYSEIRFWTDSAALVKNDDSWEILKFSGNGNSKKPETAINISYTGIHGFEYIENNDQEIILRIYKNEGYGMLSNLYGEILGPTYDDITLMASRTSETDSTIQRVFMAEKYVSEADLYIIIHLDGSGKIIRRQAMKPEEYDMIFCGKG